MTKGSFGELLKRERELREVTLNEVTVATRIPPRFLEAFEREDWEKLPGGVFNRGFVRAIARYLGLDEENLLSEYDLAYGEQRPAMSSLAEDPIPSPPKWAVAIAGIAILLLLVGAVWGSVYGWHRYAAGRGATRAALAASGAHRPDPVRAGSIARNRARCPRSERSFACATATKSERRPSCEFLGPAAPRSRRLHLRPDPRTRRRRRPHRARQPSARRRNPPPLRQKPVRRLCRPPRRGVAGVERPSNAAAHLCRSVRYNGAQPERLKAGTQWKRSALNSSKNFAVAAPPAKTSSPSAPVARNSRP